MPILLNNTRDRRHTDEYNNSAAFFDIEPHGQQHKRYAPILDELRPGDVCIVASPAHDGLFRFARWEFSHQQTLPDRKGDLHRVLFGRRVGAYDVLPKHDAARRRDYSAFFRRTGDFQRASVIRA